MRKLLKILKIGGIVLFLLFAALLAAPFLFKDDITNKIKEDVNLMLNAKVEFGEVDLSFIQNFPNARISIQDYSVVGTDRFEFDTLMSGKKLALVVDLNSVFGENQLNLKKILLEEPRINVIVLADSTANYDIVKPDSTTETSTPTEEESNIRISLQEYQIKNGFLRYSDETLPFKMSMSILDHIGSGDFTLDTYDLHTQTTAEHFTVVYDNIKYLKEAKADILADLTVSIDPIIRIDFRENLIRVNELELELDGFFSMPEDDMVMDLSYAAKQTSFRSLLSMVPGIYTEDFKDIQTEGKLAFDGFVKGTYNETQLPGFGVNLKVDDAMFHYPDLPQSVQGIQIDMKLNNSDGNLDNMQIEIPRFHADMGKNPIDVRASIRGLSRINVDAEVNAKLNLADLMQIYPIEGTTLRGNFDIDADIDGVYDDANGRFPKVEAVMNMENGYVKNEEYSTELDKLNFHASLKDPDGQLTTAVFDMPDFHFEMDKEPIDGSLHVENFDNPSYALSASGKLDLAKIMQIYPIDSMQLSGKIDVKEFSTKGTYSDIEAENYINLPTSGRVEIENLQYSDMWYVSQGASVQSGTAVFTPQRIEVSNARGKLGSSDYSASGYFSNYLAYTLLDEPLEGKMDIKSTRFNTNEWMTEDTGAESAGGAEDAPLEVIPIPANLDVDFTAQIDELIYDNMNLEKFSGAMGIANQAIEMQDVTFELLGGKVAMSGAYNTLDIRKPHYNFYLDMKQFGIKEAFSSFSTMQAYAPVSKIIEGLANMEVGISGWLKPNMMPILEDINGLGAFEVLQGGISQSNIMNAIAEKTKIQSISKLDLSGVAAQFEIKEGYVQVKPFDLNIKDIKLRIGGRQYISGKIDYEVDIDAPSGSIGDAAFSALSNLSGTNIPTSDRIQVNLLVGGTATDPKISGGSGGTGSQIKQQAKQVAEDKLNEKLGTDVKLNKDSLKNQANEIKQQTQDSLKKVAEAAKQRAKDSIDAAVEKAKREAAKKAEEKAKEVLGDEATDALKNLKDKFGFPKKKKKKK